MSEKIAVHWFRQDLRIKDNLSLEAASKCDSFIPIYILDDTNSRELKMGSASRWWLYHSLNKLNESLGGSLRLFKGDPYEILPKLVEDYSVSNVFWNRCYEPWRIDRDKKIKNELETNNIVVESFCGSLLWEPWNISKDDGLSLIHI